MRPRKGPVSQKNSIDSGIYRLFPFKRTGPDARVQDRDTAQAKRYPVTDSRRTIESVAKLLINKEITLIQWPRRGFDAPEYLKIGIPLLFLRQ